MEKKETGECVGKEAGELGSKEAEGFVCKGAEEKLNVVGPNF